MNEDQETRGPATTAAALRHPLSRRAVLKAGAAAAVGSALATTGVGATSSRTTRSSAAPNALDPSKTVRVWMQGYSARPGRRAWTASRPSSRRRPASPSQFETVDWGTAEQRWDLAMSTGDVPDIGDMFYLPARIVQGRGRVGSARPDVLHRRRPIRRLGAHRRRRSRDESTFDGKVYGIPWRIDIRGWNARSDLWPTIPATLEEMETQGLEVLKKPGVQGAGSWFRRGTDNVNMAGLAFGTTILTPDYTASNLLDPKWIEAATWMRDMARKSILLTESTGRRVVRRHAVRSSAASSVPSGVA